MVATVSADSSQAWRSHSHNDVGASFDECARTTVDLLITAGTEAQIDRRLRPSMQPACRIRLRNPGGDGPHLSFREAGHEAPELFGRSGLLRSSGSGIAVMPPSAAMIPAASFRPRLRIRHRNGSDRLAQPLGKPAMSKMGHH